VKRARKKVHKSVFSKKRMNDANQRPANQVSSIHDSVKSEKKKSKSKVVKRVLISILLVLVILIGVVSGYFIWAYNRLNNSLIGYEGVTETVPIDKKTGKVTFLLVGIDKVSRSTDTIMVACYDFNNNKVDILSIPRDTRMYIGRRYFKINSAYTSGSKEGINGTIEAVTRLTGIPINRYVEFDTAAFRNTIDALGGVDFYVPRNMNYDDSTPGQDLHIHLKEGMQHLDGNKAEQLVRFRSYPMGDIDRVKVQQDFIKALAEQKLNLTIIDKVPDIFDVIKKDIKTDLDADEVLQYTLSLPDLDSSNITMHSLPGYPNDKDYGGSYWICDMDATKELVETVFGYDASEATIHSKDGKSASKDVKSTPKPTAEPKETEKPEETDEPKTTKSPAPTKSPEATKKPSANETPKPTKTPEETKKPTVEPTKEPVKTPAPTPAPTPTQEPSQTPGGIKRPSAN